MVTTGYPICSVKVFIILPTSIVFPAALFAFEKERANWIISYRQIIIIFCQRIYDVQRINYDSLSWSTTEHKYFMKF